jgi:glycosylphosphatidylinositol transamidase (GPIT) subunit GPI8
VKYITFCLYLYYLKDSRRRDLVILVFMITYGNSAYHHERFESQYHSWRAELDTTLYKGNNKITELQTILQRESQNS